jgi:putative transposase
VTERKAVRVRMEPTAAQRAALARAAGARRFVFNWALERWQAHYRETGETIPMRMLSAELTALKREPQTAWLREMDSQLLQQALADVRRAFVNFFERRARYPRFKSRKRDRARFRIPQRVKVDGRRVFIPKVGRVRLSEEVDLTGMTLKSATFKQAATGHWFATLSVQFELPDASVPLRDDERTVGIDVGLSSLLVLSNGEQVENPRWYRAQQRRLARAQRALTRKRKGSANRQKARRKVARVHEQTANRRNDFIHKLTTRLVGEFDSIISEDLSVKGMARTKLSKSVLDAALGEISRQLEYKARWSGKNHLVVDRWFPSTKLCGQCGHVSDELTLADRAWSCPACEAEHDRDLNAARNIRAEGLKQYVVVGDTGDAKRLRRPRKTPDGRSDRNPPEHGGGNKNPTA